MNIVLFGPQGSGKGTQAGLLSEQLGLYHFSMGDALRDEVKKGTALGKKIGSIMNKGELVSDATAEKVMLKILDKEAESRGIIFDGFPRNGVQLGRLRKNFNIDAAIEIRLSDNESVKRISARRICPKCERNYNIIWIKPKVAGKCDTCNIALKMRDDDGPAEVRKRLIIYKKITLPLKKRFKELGILRAVDGNQPISEVNNDIVDILEGLER